MSASTLPILHLSFPPHDQPIASLLPAELLASQPTTTVVTHSQFSTLSTLPAASFSALVATPPAQPPSALLSLPELLKSVQRLLAGGAVVLIGLVGTDGVVGGDTSALVSELRDTLVLAGFTAVRERSHGGLTVLEATKPAWTAGASAKLSFARKTPAPTSTTTAATTPAAGTWNLSGGALGEDDAMVDEDDLLARETERVVVTKPKIASDCGPGAPGAKRKACKNCTCGLAEEMSAEERGVVAATTSVSKSACGNCSLGDAFRCAGCPFLGQPAFVNNKVGGAVKLAL